jgi:hypothetical protein
VAETEVNLTAYWAVVKGCQDLDPAAKFATTLVAAKCWDEKTTSAKLSLRDFVLGLNLKKSAASSAVQRAVKNGALSVEKREVDGTIYRLGVRPVGRGGSDQSDEGSDQPEQGVRPVGRVKTVKRNEDKGAAAESTDGRRRRPVDNGGPVRVAQSAQDLLDGLASMSRDEAIFMARSRLHAVKPEEDNATRTHPHRPR